MKPFEPGERVDGYVIDASIHSGGMADIYRVHCADSMEQPDFPIVMKVPRMTAADGAENLLGFEVERQILSVVHGAHVPRFIAAGDISRQPYLVMEYVEGRTLQDWLDRTPRRDAIEVARIGAQVARAVLGLHQQDVCHLDLKPANVLIRNSGDVVLLDFGLSWHAHYPDLLAEEMHTAVGSHIWIAPEQVVGVRGDPRSDVFAIGVLLYEMCTGELPFGDPQTPGGLRQRFWMQPKPPRQIRPELPEWLQEIILCCLQPLADDRYSSAAPLGFDLMHPEQVRITARGKATHGVSFWRQFRNWLVATRVAYRPSALRNPRSPHAPIVMVAVPHRDAGEATLEALRRAVTRVLGNRPGARLSCVTVLSPGGLKDASYNEVVAHQQALSFLHRWAENIDLGGHLATYHALPSGDVAQAILNYAQTNHVDLIIMGAATHGLQIQRFIATVPIKVAMHAQCTIMLVKG